ncbi:MAG TPA: histidine phosphatase family protein [Bacillales bacterium]|nr:histidine phosphatase family protein [Bacillales bacterium]
MKTIYIIRHCEAEGQAREAMLTRKGREQALALATTFIGKNIKKIVTSPYLRAVQSIHPTVEHFGIEAKEDERLGEWMMSVSPLEDWQAFLKQSFANLDISYEGGESGREAMTRGITVLRETLDSIGDGEAAILVSHGGLTTLLLKHFDERFGFFQWASLTNPDVFALAFSEGSLFPTIERKWDDGQ